MEGQIRIRIPAPIRCILIEWGSACDPALIPMGNHDRQRLSLLYRELGSEAGRASLSRSIVATMYVNACTNRRFGLVAEVRREGKTIVQWIEGVMARDPLLVELLRMPARRAAVTLKAPATV